VEWQIVESAWIGIFGKRVVGESILEMIAEKESKELENNSAGPILVVASYETANVPK
jgi:hypothetical protein